MRKQIGLLGLLLVTTLLMASFSLAATITIRPNGNGQYSAWINSGCISTAEYQCVDETPAITSDYLYTASASVSESFGFQDTNLTNVTINNIVVYYYGQRYSTSRYKFQPLLRISGADYLGSVKSLTATYAYYTETYNTNPATGSAWTIAEVDALQAGMKSYSSSYGGKIAQVYIVVNYSVPDSCSDTDGGYEPTIFGSVLGWLSQNYYYYDDYCVDNTTVMEYYCSGDYSDSSSSSCTGNTTCIAGACA